MTNTEEEDIYTALATPEESGTCILALSDVMLGSAGPREDIKRGRCKFPP